MSQPGVLVRGLVAFVSVIAVGRCDENQVTSALYGLCTAGYDCEYPMICIAGMCTKSCAPSEGLVGQCVDFYTCESGCCWINQEDGAGYCAPFAGYSPVDHSDLISDITDNATPLSVVLTYPPDGSTVSGIVTVNVVVVDGSAIDMVEFFVDGTSKGNDNSVPYERTWDTSSLAPGTLHTLLAVATDQAGKASLSEIVTVTVTQNEIASSDTTPPVVVVTYPPEGASVSGSVTIKAEAQDPSGIEEIVFYVDGSVECTDSSAPFSCDWTPDLAGEHAIFVSASDKAGNQGGADVFPVTVLGPSSGVCFAGELSEYCGIVDNEGCCDGHGRVYWCDDGLLKCLDCAANGNDCGWEQPLALYDCVGSDGLPDPSGGFPMACEWVADHSPPSVLIAYPYDGASVSGEVAIKAMALDSSGIQNVVFYIDGEEQCTDSHAPYECDWDTSSPNLTQGEHTVVVMAMDADGNLGMSSPVTVFVWQGEESPNDNVGPAVTISIPLDGSVFSSWAEWNGTVHVSAQDPSGVYWLALYVDGLYYDQHAWTPPSPTVLSEDLVLGLVWPSQETNYDIKAVAIDEFNNAGISEVVNITLIP